MFGIKARALAIPTLIVLSGCASPLQQCLDSATSEHDAILFGMTEAQMNITRGYAVHKQTVPYTYTGSCYDYYIGTYSCPQTGYRTQETPVSINPVEERKKLANLKRAEPAARKRAEQGALQCHASFPEEG